MASFGPPLACRRWDVRRISTCASHAEGARSTASGRCMCSNPTCAARVITPRSGGTVGSDEVMLLLAGGSAAYRRAGVPNRSDVKRRRSSLPVPVRLSQSHGKYAS